MPLRDIYYSDYQSGGSLFALSFKFTVGCPRLWEYTLFMILFIVFVDTVQRITMRYTGNDRCWDMFVNRCIAELMMFGAVAIIILMIDEGTQKTLPYLIKEQLHYVDVLCSIAACLLILVGCWVFVVVVRPRSHYRGLMHGKGSSQNVDFLVFGGKINRQLAQEYGLRGVYDFGEYVREVSGGQIADLIDINMLSWLAFGVPVLIAYIVTRSFEDEALRAFAENKTASYANLKAGGPTPDLASVQALACFGWVWMGLTGCLDLIAFDARRKLRVLYGITDIDQAQETINEVEAHHTTLMHKHIKPKMLQSDYAAVSGYQLGDKDPEDKAADQDTNAAKRKKKWSKATDDVRRSVHQEKHTEWAQKADLLSVKLAGRRAALGNATSLAALRDEILPLPDPKLHIWAARHLGWIKQALQVLMLYSCAQVAFYVLSIVNGIDSLRANTGWHIFSIAPPLITLFILLPHLCRSMSLFEAYAVPNASILDNVISDADRAVADKDYIRSQLAHRVEQSENDVTNLVFGHGSSTLGFSLQKFENNFDKQYTPLRRYIRALMDLASGQALCFVDKHACFLVGVLEIANVPISRERLERLVPWFKELCGQEDAVVSGEMLFSGRSTRTKTLCPFPTLSLILPPTDAKLHLTLDPPRPLVHSAGREDASSEEVARSPRQGQVFPFPGQSQPSPCMIPRYTYNICMIPCMHV